MPKKITERHRLRVLRAEARQTQYETAHRAGLGVNRYWRIENGWADPTSADKAAIAKALRVSQSDAFPEVTV